MFSTLVEWANARFSWLRPINTFCPPSFIFRSRQQRSKIFIYYIQPNKDHRSISIQPNRDPRSTGWFFWLVPPRKVLSVELVPPNREKWLSSLEMAKILTKKVKVRVRVCHTITFCWNLAEEIKVWRALTWTFTFLVGIFAIFGELTHFFTIRWDQFHT